jgi:PAS domain S-box-containing protein
VNIRKKTTLIIAFAVICLIILSQCAIYTYIVENVKQTEARESHDMIDRVSSEMNYETNSVDLICFNWACWDDTYNFVQDHDQQYIDVNLNTTSIDSIGVNLIVYIDNTGKDVFDVYYNSENRSIGQTPSSTLRTLLNNPLLQDHNNSLSTYGLIQLPSGPCIVSAYSILHSNNSGPSAGTLIFGKYIDETLQQKISKICGAPVLLTDFNSPDSTNTQAIAKKGLSNETHYFLADMNQSTVLSYGFINDINGHPGLLVSVQLARTAYNQGITSLTMMSIAIFSFGISIIVIIYLLVNRVVIARLTNLEDDVNRIGKNGNDGQRVTTSGKDEIYSLAEEINGMIESLEKRGRALQESEERYRSIMEQSVSAIFIIDPETKSILHSNQAFKTMFGYSTGELPQLQIYSLSPNDTFFESVLNRIKYEHRVVGIEMKLTGKAGKPLDVEISGSTIEYEGHLALCITAWDVSERHQAEESREQIERLEAVGNLAGGMAHDFNNLLTGIMGNVSLMKNQEQSNPLTIERLNNTEIAALRAKDIALELMSLARGGEPIRQHLNIVELIKSTAGIFHHYPKIQYRFTIPSDVIMVDIDPGQISRAFANLFVNAKDAMVDGGLVEVSVSYCEFAGGEHYPLAAGRYVLVTVKDSGTGIPPDVLPRIFDPFFTTKECGYGMGLSVVYATIKRHNGTVEVDSILGKGTTFRIFLPASETISTNEESQKVNYVRRECNVNGRVLLMDDQDVVIDIASEMLRVLGYEVGISRDGAEALEAYRESMLQDRRYDVVIMDLTIPQGMGGKEAVKRLLKIDPNAKVIVSSGYSSDPVMANYYEHGFIGVLPKPFDLSQLAQAVQKGCSWDSSSNVNQQSAESSP